MPTVHVNGIDIAYELRGADSAPVMVLIMGLGLPSSAWPPEFVDTLLSRNFRVLTFDNRDSGRSERMHSLPTPNLVWQALRHFLRLPVRAPYGINDMSDDTRALLDALGIRSAHVVGMSMGGMIAQRLAIDAPQKVLSLTSVMSSTGARSLPGPSAAIRRLLVRGPRNSTDQAQTEYFRALWELLKSPGYPEPESQFDALMQRITASGMSVEGAKRQTLAIAAARDRTAELRRLRVPALVVHGDADAMLPIACGYRTAEAIVDAEMIAVEGMGHNLPVPLAFRLGKLIAAHAERAAAKSLPARDPRNAG